MTSGLAGNGDKEDEMTFDELLTENRIEALNRIDTAWMRFQDEARAAHAGGTRRAIASALVRVSAWLDRGAVERAAMVTRQAHGPRQADWRSW